jgi:hypothetical protein
VSRAVRVLVVLVLAASSGACSDRPTAPTDSADTATPVMTPVSIAFTGVVGPSGTASRTFTAQLAGTATATLSAISPATALGVAFGILRADGAGCLVGRSTIAADGVSARITAAVDPGTVCLQVSGPERSADQVTFTVTLEHP